MPFLAPPGIHFKVGKSELIAFFYKDSIAAKKAWLALDTIRLAPVSTDTATPWPKAPAAVRAGNLIAALLSDSPRTIERVRYALLAGLPAPDPAATKP